MFTQLSLERLSVGSVYKLVFIGSALSLVPLSLLLGLGAMFGLSTISWNGTQVYGLRGLLFSPVIGVFLTLFASAFFGTALVVGLWLYSKARPLSLRGKNVSSER